MKLQPMNTNETGSRVGDAWRDFPHPARAFCRPRWLVALLLFSLVLGRASAATAAPRTRLPQSSAELFGLTNLWTVHLRFTSEQWEAMQPVGDDRQPLNGPGGLRRGRFLAFRVVSLSIFVPLFTINTNGVMLCDRNESGLRKL